MIKLELTYISVEGGIIYPYEDGWEGQDITRLIKQSIFIMVNNPTLNRNIGKFQLNHIWDGVLFGTPNIKVAKSKR